MAFELKKIFPTTAQVLYNAWLDSDQHSAMIGSSANCNSNVGEAFTAWDGYISGKNLELVPFSKIVQSWRTTEFGETHPDSILELRLKDTEEGCELHLIHTQITEKASNYEQGWQDHYFVPMETYFSNLKKTS